MRVQFGLGAVLQQFANPTPLFEHEDEPEHGDDFDAPYEGGTPFLSLPGVKPQAESYYPFGISTDTSLWDGAVLDRFLPHSRTGRNDLNRFNLPYPTRRVCVPRDDNPKWRRVVR